MSSTTFTHVAAEAASLPDAFAKVADDSFFALVGPCPPSSLDERWPGDPAWLYTEISFVHEGQRGQLDLALPASLAADLSGAFAGCDAVGLSDSLVSDCIGEFCNMVCGLWLTRVRPREGFALSPPLVETGMPPLAHGWSFITINDVPVGYRCTEDV